MYAIYSKTLTGTFNYYKYQTTKVSTTIYNTATSGTITAPATVGTPPTGYSFRHWARNNGFPNAQKMWMQAVKQQYQQIQLFMHVFKKNNDYV